MSSPDLNVIVYEFSFIVDYMNRHLGTEDETLEDEFYVEYFEMDNKFRVFADKLAECLNSSVVSFNRSHFVIPFKNHNYIFYYELNNNRSYTFIVEFDKDRNLNEINAVYGR